MDMDVEICAQDKSTETDVLGLEGSQLLNSNEKKRRRPATKAIRTELKMILEREILKPGSKLLVDFNLQSDGLLGAPLQKIFEKLKGREEIDTQKFSNLSTFALKSISNVTRVFKLLERDKTLWIIVDPAVQANSEDKTVYVDNLPAQCSEQRLRRRAEIFGTVVQVKLPRIPRIQRRLSQGINQPVLNSGFGFIQFASKTAVRRFCKRYVANSRLKQGTRRHSTKRKEKAAKNLSNQVKVDDSNAAAALSSEVTVSQDGQEIDGINHRENKEPLSASWELFDGEENSNDVREEQKFFHPPNPLQTAQPVHRKRDYSFSLTESMMSIEDSGNETDVFVEQKEVQTEKPKRNKKRVRLRKSTVESGSLTNLLKRIQVFPLKQYRELRAEYLKLQKEKMVAMKKNLLNQTFSSNADARLKPTSKEETKEMKKELKTGPKRRRRRKRGYQRLMGRASSLSIVPKPILSPGDHSHTQ